MEPVATTTRASPLSKRRGSKSSVSSESSQTSIKNKKSEKEVEKNAEPSDVINNGNLSDKPEKNGCDKPQENGNSVPNEEDKNSVDNDKANKEKNEETNKQQEVMEPLILQDEIKPEQQNTGDISPVLNKRLVKQNKPIEKNENQKDEKLSQRVSVSVTKIPVPNDQTSEEGENSDATVDTESSIKHSQISIDNASIMANYSGNDSTQNIDFDENSFVNLTKDLSYSETLRVIGGRKTVRDLRQQSLENRLKASESSGRSNTSIMSKVFEFGRESSASMKRKLERSVTPDENSKRKKEDGFFSYVRSPLEIFKRRPIDSTMASSTPKDKHSSDDSTENEYEAQSSTCDEISGNETAPKSRCSIQ